MTDTFEQALAGRVDAMLDACTRCGKCVEACPVDAITSEDQVPAEWEQYIENNAAYFRNGR